MNSWKWTWLLVMMMLAACGQPKGNVEPQKSASAEGKAGSEVMRGYEDAIPGPGSHIYNVVLQAKDEADVGAHIQYMHCLRLVGPQPVTGNYRVTPVNCPGMTTPHEWKAQNFVAQPGGPSYILEPVVGGPKHTNEPHDAFMQILETDIDGAPKKIKVWMEPHKEEGTHGDHAGSAHLRY